VIRLLLLAAAVALDMACHIPTTCNPDEPDTADEPDAGGPKPNPGANGLPGECEPFDGRCDPNRCPRRTHITPAPDCMCVDDPIDPDAGMPI
jgi:hypothetical protein